VKPKGWLERRLAAAALALVAACSGATGAPAEPTPSTPPEHRRGGDQTFLTFPEWFLVFSPAEYATFVARRPPSEFPFFGHVAQFWRSYRAVYEATKDKYPVNTEYHVMIGVIGVSTSVEYGLHLAYETLVGRLTEATCAPLATEEDRLAAAVAQGYVDFIRVRPWYEFDFASRLARVWQAQFWGAHPLRKWERKYALTTEYGVKAVYGWLLGRATKASYGEAVPLTATVVDGLPPEIETELPELKTLDRLSDGAALVTVPRYEAFTHHALRLAQRQTKFVEIAGNRGGILVTALVPRGWRPVAGAAQTLFTQPILTDPSTERLALVVPVGALDVALRELADPPRRLEHVFDY